MKTLVLFLVLALALFVTGCEENGATRISANPVDAAASGASVVKVFKFAERVDIKMPDGTEGMGSVIGEIRYEAIKAQPGFLLKEIPIRPLYSLKTIGEGEVNPLFLSFRNALAKPVVWTFKGTFNKVAQESEVFTLTFNLEGTNNYAAYLHVEVQVHDGQILDTALRVDLQEKAAE